METFQPLAVSKQLTLGGENMERAEEGWISFSQHNGDHTPRGDNQE